MTRTVLYPYAFRNKQDLTTHNSTEMGNSTTPNGRPISTIDDLISSRYSKSVSTNHTLNPGNECIAASYSVIGKGCQALVLAECIVWPSSHYQDLLQNISA